MTSSSLSLAGPLPFPRSPSSALSPCGGAAMASAAALQPWERKSSYLLEIFISFLFHSFHMPGLVLSDLSTFCFNNA